MKAPLRGYCDNDGLFLFLKTPEADLYFSHTDKVHPTLFNDLYQWGGVLRKTVDKMSTFVCFEALVTWRELRRGLVNEALWEDVLSNLQSTIAELTSQAVWSLNLTMTNTVRSCNSKFETSHSEDKLWLTIFHFIRTEHSLNELIPIQTPWETSALWRI